VTLAQNCEVKGKWRRLNNEKVYDLYFSPNITRVKKKIKQHEVGIAPGTYRQIAHSHHTKYFNIFFN
jgi:hypothetical protein